MQLSSEPLTVPPELSGGQPLQHFFTANVSTQEPRRVPKPTSTELREPPSLGPQPLAQKSRNLHALEHNTDASLLQTTRDRKGKRQTSELRQGYR
ncbi:hypothetical protein F2Q69_00000651 [Brassica cretica]|uniref:Uncharacterized protein n=1 Tax=Brassica cretica TaxID=69181 RepID=A0A8S9P002_BRACR|nr:hypothetical protein F2Q69_00000651 [Brassica cretica]